MRENLLREQKFLSYLNIQWAKAIRSIFNGSVPSFFEWTSFHQIYKILQTLGQERISHLFYEQGGGMDLVQVERAYEPGSLIATESYDVISPERLTFNSFGSDLDWAYFRLESKYLQPIMPDAYLDDGRERVVEIEPGRYEELLVWEHDYLLNEQGEEIPLPKSARLLCRYVEPKTFLIFPKGSLYNQEDINDYSGKDNKLSDADFRVLIGRIKAQVDSSNA